MERAFVPGDRVVVAGGAGFLGSHLCDTLIASGVHVECLDNLSTGRIDNIAGLVENPGFHFRRVDVTEPVDVTGNITAVLHLASPASPEDYRGLPLSTLLAGSAGTVHLLRLAEKKSARFVLASSSEVYGEPAEHPQHEGYWGNVNTVGPRSVYDEAKRFSEAMTACFHRDLGTDTGIVRIFNSYGPRIRPDDGRMVPTLIRQALTGDAMTITGTGKQTRSLCFVDDTVRGLLAFAATPYPGPINIGAETETTVHHIAELIGKLTRSTAPTRFISRPVDDPTRRRPDTTLARELLGWAPTVPLTEGLPRTIKALSTELGRCASVVASDTVWQDAAGSALEADR